MPAVEVDRLVIRYGDLVAVDGLSFTAEAGEVLALLGPNGAGKTSTIEALEGYRRPAEGAVRVLGHDPVAERAAVVGSLGVMLQGGGTYPRMGSARALRLFASYYENPRDVDELLALVGLTSVARTPARRLSGGERQRLTLALALVGRPRVAFLDEPSAGIDPAGRLVIRDVVRGLAQEGVAVVLTTHELDEAEHVADRVVIVDHGRAVAAGRPADLVSANDALRFEAAEGIDCAALGAALAATVREERPGSYLVETAPSPRTVAALTAWLAERDLSIGELHAGTQRLEDVFLELTAPTAETASGPERRRSRQRARRS